MIINTEVLHSALPLRYFREGREHQTLPNKEKCCCFSGHRPAKLPWGTDEDNVACLALKEELFFRLEGIYEAGYRHFICGMALGCDMYFAEAVIELRHSHPDVTLEAAIPCGSQPEKWTERQRRRYNRILDACTQVTVLQIGYSADCMMKRNMYMVDHSSLLLTCFDGRPGGTMSTIVYAQRNDVKVIIIDV